MSNYMIHIDQATAMTKVNSYKSPATVPIQRSETIRGGLLSRLARNARNLLSPFSSPTMGSWELPKGNVPHRNHNSKGLETSGVEEIPTCSLNSHASELYKTVIEYPPVQAVSLKGTKIKDMKKSTSPPSRSKLSSSKISSDELQNKNSKSHLSAPLNVITTNRIVANQTTCSKASDNETNVDAKPVAVSKVSSTAFNQHGTPKKALSSQTNQLKDTIDSKQYIPKEPATLKVPSIEKAFGVEKHIIKSQDFKEIRIEKITNVDSSSSKTTKLVAKEVSPKVSFIREKDTRDSLISLEMGFARIQSEKNPSEKLTPLQAIPHQSTKCKMQESIITPQCNLNQSPFKQNIDKQLNELIPNRMSVDELSEQLDELSIAPNFVSTQSSYHKVAKDRQYLDVPLDPQIHEVISNTPIDIEPNIVKGSYRSPVHYLNVHVKLLREDCMASLRDGIQQIRRNYLEYGVLRTNEHITLYPNCHFVCKSMKKKVLGYEFCFDTNRQLSLKRWKLLKSLFTGSLLAFSCDNFETFFFGIVARNDEFENRAITVELCNDKQLVYSEFNTTYAMIEPSAFFAPYYYVIKTLQCFSNDNFPFEQYIINTRSSIKQPIYFLKDRRIFQEYNLSNEAQIELGLNEIQFDAYTTALTKELAIIQGPPGTGKTHVGLRIVQAFLNNQSLMNYINGPILIVCFTNHALDQFIQGVLRYTHNVCRLGYSKNNKLVKPFNHLEMIETFIAMKSVCARGHRQTGIGYVMDDFDILFTPDEEEIYMLQVRSFKKNRIEKRLYNVHLMKAYFSMYVKSPFNEKNCKYQCSVRNECCSIERSSQRIRQKINLIHAYNGIVAVKYLIEFMDDISFFALASTGALDRWLTVRVLDDDDESDCDSDDKYYDIMSNDSDVSIDRKKNVFYSIDMADVQNEIENTEFEINDLRKRRNQASQSFEYLIVKNLEEKETELRKRLVKLRQFCHLVGSNLHKIKHGNLTTEVIKKILVQNISSKKQLYGLCLDDRWKLYWYWLQCYRRKLYDQMELQAVEYEDVLEEYMEVVRNPDFVKVLKTKHVVAMTTTKAAKIHDVLCKLKPKIVVIEEAAEVLESHIIASLTKDCEHLVLIGDHQQLRPGTNVHTLASDYKLDVSLFERLVNNDLDHVTLQVQHRMRPDISSLLTPTIYTTLLNHPSVEKYPTVKGMNGNVQFFDHKVCEGRNNSLHNTWNSFEVNILLKLAQYLLKQGHHSRDITIITAYGGQKDLFETTIEEKYPFLSSVLITTIDGFQGEENKIILLSLVRSNLQNKIGFLKTPNRVCVALSRAKHGLYMIGNMKCLSHESELWAMIKNKLLAQGSIFYDGFKLSCSIHRRGATVRTVDDFNHCCCLKR